MNFFGRKAEVWSAIVVCLLITIMAFLITPMANALRLDYLSAVDWIIIAAFSFLSVFINWRLKKAGDRIRNFEALVN
jgi:hypothetical protein